MLFTVIRQIETHLLTILNTQIISGEENLPQVLQIRLPYRQQQIAAQRLALPGRTIPTAIMFCWPGTVPISLVHRPMAQPMLPGTVLLEAERYCSTAGLIPIPIQV